MLHMLLSVLIMIYEGFSEIQMASFVCRDWNCRDRGLGQGTLQYNRVLRPSCSYDSEIVKKRMLDLMNSPLIFTSLLLRCIMLHISIDHDL